MPYDGSRGDGGCVCVYVCGRFLKDCQEMTQ